MSLDPRTLKAIGLALASCAIHTETGNHEEALEKARLARDLLDMAILGARGDDYATYSEKLKSDSVPVTCSERDTRPSDDGEARN